mgnify:CR=1 FL=1
MTKTLLINSTDRYDGTSTNFKLDMRNSYKVKNVKLLHCRIPVTWHNIDSYNNTILFNEGGSNLTATLTQGSYNISDLQTEIETQMDSAGADIYTVTYDKKTMKITISSTGTFSLLFGTSSSEIYEILGFDNIDTSTASSQTGNNVIDLIRVKNILIKIPELGIFGRSTNDDDKYTFIIPVNQNRSEFIRFNDNDNFNQIKILDDRLITELTIIVKDERNRALELNSSEICLILELC